jgi:hypothetical protein
MEHLGTGIVGFMVLGGIVFVVALVLCWIVLPFAIVGTKPILRDILREMREANRLQREINDRMKPAVKPLYTERPTP